MLADITEANLPGDSPYRELKSREAELQIFLIALRLLIFARRMKLPEDQMKPIRTHWEAGRPIVGIRTASHAFQKPDNDVFDRQILGGSHQNHWDDEPVKVTNQPDQAGHPVLRGVGPFVSRKLYKRADLLKDVIVLQTGDNGKDTQPVTLTRVHNGGRIVYTSLGVPEDFKDDNFRRLLMNALFWTTHRDPERMKKVTRSVREKCPDPATFKMQFDYCQPKV